METIRQPSPWDHLGVFDDQELLSWLGFYRDTEVPRWAAKAREALIAYHRAPGFIRDRKLRSLHKDYHRACDMRNGLEAEARKRGLIP